MNRMDIYSKLQSYKHATHTATPFTLSYKSETTQLILVGMSHTFDPQDKELKYIEDAFNVFADQTSSQRRAVVEGGLRGEPKDRTSAIIEHGGEGGLLTFLAQQSGIEVACYEPDLVGVHQAIAKESSADLVALSHISDIAFQYHNENPDVSQAEYADQFLKELAETLGTTYTIARINHIASDILESPVDIFADEDTAYLLADPTNPKNPIRETAEAITRYRDAAVLEEIIKHHRAHIDQFVVYGSSHVDLWKAYLDEELIAQK